MSIPAKMVKCAKIVFKYLKPLLPEIIGALKKLISKKSKELSEKNLNTNENIVDLNEELENFNKNLELQFSENEKIIRKKIEEQLGQYIEIAQKLEEYPEVRKNTLKRIKNNIKRYESSIDGLLLVLSRKNISIDNNYLIKILKMDKSPTKERMLEDFIVQSMKKTLEEYSARILKDLSEISENILEEFNDLIEDLEIEKKIEVNELTKLEDNIKNSFEKEKTLCNKNLEMVFLKNILRKE